MKNYIVSYITAAGKLLVDVAIEAISYHKMIKKIKGKDHFIILLSCNVE